MLVMVETRTGAHFLRGHVGIGSESRCLSRHSKRVFEISDSVTGLKAKKNKAMLFVRARKCGNNVVEKTAEDRRSGIFYQ